MKNITRLYGKYGLFFMLLWWSISATAQNGMSADQPYFVSASWQTGLLFPHHESIMFFVDEPVNGFEVLAGKNLNDQQSWHRYYHSPQTGFGVYHSGLGNHEVYGTTTGFFAFFRTGILPLHGRFRLTQSTGAGLAYLDKRFNLENDYFNRAIGSHVNVFLKFTTAFSWQLTSRLKIDAGGSFIHMSNGNIKTPNFGLNLITAQTGLTWNLDRTDSYMPVTPSTEKNSENTEPTTDLKRLHVNVMLAGGIRESSRRIDRM
ncbi:MAG TPA: acyloxyacyl hydrolase, partial [Bacteroidales bacterium]|nr:acyloxyacyl hydrolase [Bacteroidales bacterium]